MPETTESKIIGNVVLETGEYSVRAACENCGHRGHIIAKRGTLVTGVYTCPYCGCKTLRADWKLETGEEHA
jgi:predicted RNA-binding Zn-ribbon protein involved in translation (DUF1610 family)